MVKLPFSRGPATRPAIYASLITLALTLPVMAAPALWPAAPLQAEDGRIRVAQNQSAAELLVRIQDLEQLVRQLTGRVEGLEFQLTQMAKQQEDNEFRFQQLEGGAVGKPQAAAPTDGAMPSDTLPQAPAPQTNTELAGAPPAGEPPIAELPAGGGAAMDDIGDSADPLLKGGIDQLGTMSEDQQLANRPLDLSLSGGVISNGDANAQYQAGYDAMTRGDYAFAEDQFTQFVSLYPNDPQVPDAINWLGEALIQRGAYTDAAQVLADGYTKHKDSPRAPDIMLKLGVALVGADQVDVGCRTFYTLKQRYPDLSPAFQQRLGEEQQKAQCPVAN